MAGLTQRAWYRHAEKVWYALSIGYDVLWVVVFGKLLSPYGVNIAVLAVVVVVATVPYAVGVARLVRAVLERRFDAAWKWGLVGAGGFLAPDVYVLIASGKNMPWYLLVGFLTWVSLAAFVGIRSVRKKIREGRRIHVTELPTGDADESPAA